MYVHKKKKKSVSRAIQIRKNSERRMDGTSFSESVCAGSAIPRSIVNFQCKVRNEREQTNEREAREGREGFILISRLAESIVAMLQRPCQNRRDSTRQYMGKGGGTRSSSGNETKRNETSSSTKIRRIKKEKGGGKLRQ